MSTRQEAPRSFYKLEVSQQIKAQCAQVVDFGLVARSNVESDCDEELLWIRKEETGGRGSAFEIQRYSEDSGQFE